MAKVDSKIESDDILIEFGDILRWKKDGRMEMLFSWSNIQENREE